MIYKHTTFFKLASIAIDYCILNTCLFTGLFISTPEYFSTGIPDQYKLNFLLCNLFWFYCANLFELYKNVLSREAKPTIKACILALTVYFFGPTILNIFLPRLTLSFHFIWISSFLFIFLTITGKLILLIIRKTKRHLLINYKKIVIIGANQTGITLSNHIRKSPHLGYKVEGFFDDKIKSIEDVKILGNINYCFEYAKAYSIDEVFYTLSDTDSESIKKFVNEADKNMIRFRLVPDVNHFFNRNILVDVFDYVPILTHRQEPLENQVNRLIKRCFDITISLIVIIVILSWLIPVMAIIIKLESKGPVFFRQLRSGTYNKPFFCLKFRSMTVNKDSDNKQATKGDMRITKVGAFIRKTSIDELPQFFNVLKGDMSVIGPRPHMIKHTEDYAALIDEYMVRHYLTPGISGWAQVNGFRGETKDTESMQKRIEADIWYLENWSLLLDLKIMFLTIWKAIRGDQNAY